MRLLIFLFFMYAEFAYGKTSFLQDEFFVKKTTRKFQKFTHRQFVGKGRTLRGTRR